jgi:hypothetical protein
VGRGASFDPVEIRAAYGTGGRASQFGSLTARSAAALPSRFESPVQKPENAFICPAQWTPSGKKTECCATCALCWSTTKKVAFLQH